jgi:hypothetical protein
MHLPLTTHCRWVSPRTRWCDRIVASGSSPVNSMGSCNTPTPLTTTIIKTTEDTIKFFKLLRTGCRMRSIEWWLNDALEEFPSVNVCAAAIRALDKAMRIDQLMEQNLDTALAPQGGIRLDMNTADETPAPRRTHPVLPLPRHQPVTSSPAARHVRTQDHRDLGADHCHGSPRRRLSYPRHGLTCQTSWHRIPQSRQEHLRPTDHPSRQCHPHGA